MRGEQRLKNDGLSADQQVFVRDQSDLADRMTFCKSNFINVFMSQMSDKRPSVLPSGWPLTLSSTTSL